MKLHLSGPLLSLALLGCSSGPGPTPDGGGPCLALTPPTALFEDSCASGICYFDHPSQSGF